MTCRFVLVVRRGIDALVYIVLKRGCLLVQQEKRKKTKKEDDRCIDACMHYAYYE